LYAAGLAYPAAEYLHKTDIPQRGTVVYLAHAHIYRRAWRGGCPGLNFLIKREIAGDVPSPRKHLLCCDVRRNPANQIILIAFSAYWTGDGRRHFRPQFQQGNSRHGLGSRSTARVHNPASCLESHEGLQGASPAPCEWRRDACPACAGRSRIVAGPLPEQDGCKRRDATIQVPCSARNQGTA
jgi:hypothetical protein